MACTLIPLDKKPGLRPIGVGEVLRRIAGKAVMMLFKNDITHAQVLYNYNLVLDRIQESKLLYTLCMIFFPKKTQKPFY